jgi:pimeloyl-ACP methyl ester carboxylesterase
MKIGTMQASAVLAVFILHGAFQSSFAQVWTRTSAARSSWISVASSSDGNQLVVVSDTVILRSTNSGLNWSPGLIFGSPFVGRWVSVACSANGLKLVAARFVPASGEGGIYVSTNAGATWAKTSAPTNVAWTSLTSSADGSFLVAAARDRIDVSYDSGATWLRTGALATRWTSVAASASGRRLLAAADAVAPPVLVSADYGNSWLAHTNTPSWYRSAVGSSANGGRLVAVVSTFGGLTNNGRIFTSSDFGAHWRQANAPVSDWSAVAVSANGARMVAAVSGGWIYTSRNFGASWSANNAPSLDWTSVASSSDGGKLVAAARNDGIYILQETAQANVSLQVLDANPLYLESLLLPQATSAALLQSLASASKTRFQAAADGLTKLLLRFECDRPGTVTFNLENTALGTLTQIDGSPLLGETTTSQVGSKHLAFALYTVPDQATEADNIVDFSASFTGDSFAQAAAEVKLVQTPVLLVHGLWGNGNTWEALRKRFNQDGIEARKVVYWDATLKAAAPFATYKGRVYQTAKDALTALRGRGIAVTQVDVVAHSMGGIITRMDVNESESHSIDSFGAGHFRRVITVNTPHWGTPAAEFLLTLAKNAKGLSGLLARNGNPVDLGAVEDLSSSRFAGKSGIEAAGATQGLSLPSVAFTTFVTRTSEFSEDIATLYKVCRFWIANFLTDAENEELKTVLCGDMITNDDDNITIANRLFFNFLSDGVVSFESQLGGCSKWLALGGITHTDVPNNDGLADRIIEILKGSVSQLSVAGFPAVTGSDLRTQTCISEVSPRAHLATFRRSAGESETPLITLTTPSTVTAGEEVTIEARPLDGSDVADVLFLAKANHESIGVRRSPDTPFRASLTVPVNFIGSLEITAIAASGQRQVDIHERAIRVFSAPGVSLQSMVVETEAGTTNMVFRQLAIPQSIRVSGVFTDGVTRDISAPETGTAYSSSNESVVIVDNGGKVAVVGNGSAEITVINGNVMTAIPVLVALEPPSILSITPNSLPAGRSNKTVVIVGDNFGGATNVAFLQDGKPDQHIKVGKLMFGANAANIQVSVSIDKDAPSGLRTILVTTPVGSSTNKPVQGNRFFVGTPLLLKDVNNSNGGLRFNVVGSTGSRFVVEKSTDLMNWTAITTNALTFGTFDFTESRQHSGSRYYRAVLLPD